VGVLVNTLQTGPDGERRLHSVGRDVTARRRAEEALRESQQFLARTGKAAGVGGWEYDLTSGVMKWSPEIRRIHEVPDDFTPTLESSIDAYLPEARETIREAVRRACEEGRSFDLELPLMTARGRRIWVRAVGEVERDPDGRPARLVGACQDITERKTLQADVERQSATLRAVIEAIPAMVAVLDFELRIQLVNRAFERWLGKTREALMGARIDAIAGVFEPGANEPWAKRALAGETVSFEKEYSESAEHRFMNINYVPLRFADGTVQGIIAVAQDITVHRTNERRLLDLAARDALTGALNRAGFNAFLAAAIEAGEAESLALLYIDLDGFKAVNDRHGHPVGDEVLSQLAQRLQRTVRPTDAVARLGGDEFAVVLRGIRSLADADAVAQKVEAAARAPFEFGDLVLTIGASIGVAVNANDGNGSAGLIARADAALYKTKLNRRASDRSARSRT
jgi:diguanylate cyclase (GGDEF)-like protein/PAS domain S-box-containing protein